jgi:HK97 family phage major capsid protein
MWQQIKQLNEQRGTLLTEMRSILKVAEDDKGRDLTAEESGKFDEINTRAEGIKSKIERIERAYGDEQRGEGDAHPGRGSVASSAPAEGDEDGEKRTEEQADAEQRSEFSRYLRDQIQLSELRSLTVAGQGIVGTREFVKTLVVGMKWYAGVLAAGAEVMNTSTGNPIIIPTLTDIANTARQVAEAATNANATDPTVGTLQLDAYKFDSDWIKVSVEMLQDNEYGLEGKITSIAAQRLGRKLNTATTTGTGLSQINGVVTATSTGTTAAAVAAITYDELLDLQHSVDAAYRQSGSCKFMLHDLTLAAIRKLKDTAGRYIWAAGEAGMPGKLIDSDYVVNNDMAQLATGNATVLYGDFSKYVVRNVATPTVIRANELFIGDGLIGFKVIGRYDGDLADTTAIKKLVQA